jgi:hypothetical protein
MLRINTQSAATIETVHARRLSGSGHRHYHRGREVVMDGRRASPTAALLLTVISCVAAGCSSSSGGSAIIGEWQLTTDATALSYYDSNGTGGVITALGGQRACIETFSYTFDGSTVTSTQTRDGGVIGMPQTGKVSFSGNKMTISTPGYPDAVWSRVNSSGTNTCP